MGSGASQQSGDKPAFEGNVAGAIVNKQNLLANLTPLASGDDNNQPPGAAMALAALLQHMAGVEGVFLTREQMRASFVPAEGDTAAACEAWCGTLVDCFSPDYDTAERRPWEKETRSRRFVDDLEGTLCISGDHGPGALGRWGRRFDPASAVNPTLAPLAGCGASTRVASYLSKVPADAPVRADAEAGALEFLVTLGTIEGVKCLRWSTTYKGKGGKFGAHTFPPDEAENFWVYV